MAWRAVMVIAAQGEFCYFVIHAVCRMAVGRGFGDRMRHVGQLDVET
jgi:hypothetical protein